MDRDKLPELSLAAIEDLKRKGFSQSDIAELYGVTRQAISYWIKTYGGRKTPRQEVLQSWPLTVPQPMTQTAVYRNLRNHAEYVITGGVGMKPDDLKRLEAFYRFIVDNDFIVEFDPTLVPPESMTSKGGWAWRTRRKSDGDLLIRENNYITATTEDWKDIWLLPEGF